MSLFSSIGILLVSFTGIIAGIALSYIAPEELASGKKYFIILKRVLFMILFLVGNYYLITIQNYLWQILFTIAMVAIGVADTIRRNKFMPLLTYIPTSIIVLIVQPPPLFLAISIFLYGFPIGTLLRIKEI